MLSPGAVNGHMGDAVGGMNMGRPHNLPIPGYHGYHHGNPTGEISHMYANSDAPVGEQVDTRQPPFTTVGGEDLICGQGTTDCIACTKYCIFGQIWMTLTTEDFSYEYW
jgi:hypothetical protein